MLFLEEYLEKRGSFMKKLCVIGSLNMDLVATVDRFPKPGETITGRDFGTYPGGKGANQAVAAGRLGADVRMVGKVGDDLYGRQYLKVLNENGVSTDGVGIQPATSTGVAVIEVDGSGENHIVIIAGANGKVDREYIDQKLEYLMECDIFLFQLEIPLDTVMYAMNLLKSEGKVIIFDPAPAAKLPDGIFPLVDYITPNETELQVLTGMSVAEEGDILKGAAQLLEKGVKVVVAKAGKNGAYIADGKSFTHIPGFSVEVVDTTAAGDSFNAGLAFALSRRKDLIESVRFANAVGALSTTAKGAQGAMPKLEEVEALIGKVDQE